MDCSEIGIPSPDVPPATVALCFDALDLDFAHED